MLYTCKCRPPGGLLSYAERPKSNRLFVCYLSRIFYFQFEFRFLSAFIAWLTERELKKLQILRFETCVKEELLNVQLMQTNYVPKHSWEHVDSEYVSYVHGV